MHDAAGAGPADRRHYLGDDPPYNDQAVARVPQPTEPDQPQVVTAGEALTGSDVQTMAKQLTTWKAFMVLTCAERRRVKTWLLRQRPRTP